MKDYTLQFLTGTRLRVFLAVANRILPPDEHSPGGGTMETAGVVDWAMRRLDPKLRKLFLTFLVVVEYLGIFFGGRPFSRNSAAAQDRQLRWLENCPLRKFRLGFFGLKSYVCMGYYTREPIWESIDYAGPHLAERPFSDVEIRALCQERLVVREP